MEQCGGTVSQGGGDSGGSISQGGCSSHNWSLDGDPVCVSIGGGKGGGDCRSSISYGGGCVCCEGGGGCV
jgi:hypothetical protein